VLQKQLVAAKQFGDIRCDPPRSKKLVADHWQWLAGTCY
jgi:hypothetical protein